jgi:hypothetical protein
MQRSRVIAPQDGPIEATTERAERDLSPTSELISRGGEAEQLERGEERIEQRAAEGNLAAQTFEGGTAIQEAGAQAAEDLRNIDSPVPGDVGTRAAAIGVGGAGFAAGLGGQAVGAGVLAGEEGLERLPTSETVESIGFAGSRQSRAIAEEPIATGLSVAAPTAAARGARAASPRVRTGAETLVTEFQRGGRSRAQLQIGRQRGRQEAAQSREITAGDLATERARAEIRGPTERAIPGARSQDLPAATGFDVARFGDPVTSGRSGGASGSRAPVEGAIASGAAERQAAAEEPAVRVDDALDTETQQTQPRSEPTQRQDELQALDEAARERQVSIEAAADTSLEGIDSRNATRDRQRDRAATATTASIAERARATQSPTQSTPTDTTPTQPSTDTPQLPRAVRGGGDGDDDDSDDEMSFTLLAQENLFPARDPITGPGNVLEEAGFE